jgi:hypothetical protein
MSMDMLTRDEVMRLIARHDRYCVSIYMPTPRNGSETLEGPIGLKNLLRAAEDRLVALGVSGHETMELLGPARALLHDRIFWQRAGEGLAIFLAPGTARILRLPWAFELFVAVGERHHVVPLLHLEAGEERFYILALSENDVRLLDATRDHVRSVDTGDAPTSLEEALANDDPDPQFQYHTAAPPPGHGGGLAGGVHGYGVGVNEPKTDLARYCRRVDTALAPWLHAGHEPLVLAGVDSLTTIFAAVTHAKHLVATRIAGNPDALLKDELRRRAWRIVRPLFAAGRDEAVMRCAEHLAKADGLAAGSPESIVSAAHAGRIATLFLADGAHVWGTYDPATAAIHTHLREQRGDDDLLDLAAVRTLEHRGDVQFLEARSVPGGGPGAALLRPARAARP